MGWVNVRYIVNNVSEAMAFYTEHLGFEVDMHPAPGFARLHRGNLRLLLNAPGAGGAGSTLPGERTPEAGGWNRFQLELDNLPGKVEALRRAGVRFRSDIVHGNGGLQILVDNPSGNPIELFEPHARGSGSA